jgi:hypothetical protein
LSLLRDKLLAGLFFEKRGIAPGLAFFYRAWREPTSQVNGAKVYQFI